MAFSKSRLRREVRLELAPLIDVIFILLIFFAVSTTMILNEQGLSMQLPASESSHETEKGLTLSIDEDQKVYIDKNEIDVKTLRAEISRRMQADPALQVNLQAHKETPYQFVVSVLDDVRLGGCYDIVLEAIKQSKN